MTLDDLVQRVAALERIVHDRHMPTINEHGDRLDQHDGQFAALQVELHAVRSMQLAIDARTMKMANMMTMQDAALERLLRQSDRQLELMEGRADTAVTKVPK